MAPATAIRRLPGVRFEAQPPDPVRVLPRMDVTGFCGFASAGPLHVPVAVEDAAAFADVFGADARLAWDDADARYETAQLAPAVRAFFRNGGRRAWIVRVAGDAAERAVLPVAGLVERVAGAAARPARLSARCRGSWGDDLRVSAALTSTPALLRDADFETLVLELLAVPGTVAAGDLLRIALDDLVLHAVVAEASAGAGAATRPGGRTLVTVTADPAASMWLQTLSAPPAEATVATYVDAAGREREVRATFVPPPDPGSPPDLGSPPEPGSPPDLAVARPQQRLAVDLDAPTDAAPLPGTLLHIGVVSGTHALWLRVLETGRRDEDVRITGEPAWEVLGTPAELPLITSPTPVERLGLELRVRRGEHERHVIADLGLAPAHPRYVGDLPTDEQLFTPRELQPEPEPDLWAEAASPRFPLGRDGDGEIAPVFHPIAVGTMPGSELGPLQAAGGPLLRDGLESFADAGFLDPDLAGVGERTLLDQSGHLRWQQPSPRRLRGVHALLDVDEVTILCAPDAAQRPWSPRTTPNDPVVAPGSAAPPAARRPGFDDCSLHRIEPVPELKISPRDPGGSYELSWTAVDEPGGRYVLQESTDAAGWDAAEAVYVGIETSVRLYGRGAGTRFYRVRMEAGANVSAWSNGVFITDLPDSRPVVVAEDEYSADALLNVQLALLRICAARGDMLALLSMPRHYRGADAIAHADRLRANLEPRTASFGALYHPWLWIAAGDRSSATQAVAPDGSVAGLVARRAATRGAWVAPANEPLADVVALVRPADRAAYGELQDAQVNVVRQEPRGFLCLLEDTLTRERELRPVNVRRLLSLVRRLALREGAGYVFEPNDPVLRRSIERGFGEVMRTLHRLGAFAPTLPHEAYQVRVGNPPNTPASVDNGRLIVELRLAPSQPLAFLLVRLVHGGKRELVVEGT